MAADSADPRLRNGDISFFGALLAGGCGAGLAILGGYLMFTTSMSRPLCVALLILGTTNVILAERTIRGSRIAWSFLLSSCGTLVIIFLFGAPKLRDAADTSLGLAALPFLVFLITSTLLGFREGDVARAKRNSPDTTNAPNEEEG